MSGLSGLSGLSALFGTTVFNPLPAWESWNIEWENIDTIWEDNDL